ncbi:MAG: FAD-dependent oxidoreductase, partial [Oscillospiraceae bacterium]
MNKDINNDLNTILEPEKKLKIIEDVDVCVIGGSCTGVFAAVRAARLGMRTVIIEGQNCFGGVATNGLVNIWHSLHDNEHKEQIIGGLTCEVLDRLRKINCLFDNEKALRVNDYNAYYFNSEELKIELDKLVLENNIKPYLHTKYCSAITKNDEIQAIIIENKDGRHAIKAKMFIDASGDGDLCRSVNVSHRAEKHTQPPTACAKLYGMNKTDGFNIQQALADHGSDYGIPEDWGWNTIVPYCDDITMHAETHIFNVNCAK